MCEMRRISNRLEDYLAEINMATGKEKSEIVDVQDIVEKEREVAVTTPFPPLPPKRLARRKQARGGVVKKAPKSRGAQTGKRPRSEDRNPANFSMEGCSKAGGLS